MTFHRRSRRWMLLFVSWLASGALARSAADTESLRALVEAQGVSGQEEPVRQALQRRLPAGVRPEVDNLGNLILVVGSGSPVRLVLAPLDEPGYVVSRIQEDGYLRLQRLSRLPLPPLYDQFLLGQPVQIGTASPDHLVAGVAAVLSTHLQRGRRRDPSSSPPPSDEDLVIDVGARSAAEAQSAGVRLLAPVTLRKKLTPLAGSRIAGPSLGDRAACVVLLELARRMAPAGLRGRLVLAWTAQSWVGGRGAARLARRFSPDEVIVVDPYVPDSTQTSPRAPEGRLGKGPLLARSAEGSGLSAQLEKQLGEVARRRGIPLQRAAFGNLHDGRAFTLRKVSLVGIPLRFPGTAVETVDRIDLDRLVDWLAAYLGATS